MKDTELKRRKAEALYAVYKQGLEEGRFDSLLGAGRWCASHPAPCFFISAKQASILLGRIQSRVSLINLGSAQRRMVWQLYGDYQRYLEEHPGTRLSRERILEILVDRPAPEFFISPEGARKVLRQEINKARKKHGW
ncbi:MAG: hypothetical protein J6Y27_00475 [Bacteroidales bacterium]|nr:hypothetical protein [Bacteroidales bacterium]